MPENTALCDHDIQSAVMILKEIGIDDEAANAVANKLSAKPRLEAEKEIAALIAAGGDPRQDNILTAYLILKHTHKNRKRWWQFWR